MLRYLEMIMRKILIILCVIILNIYCQEIEKTVECNLVDIDPQQLKNMTINEQEEYVNKLFLSKR
jgi:hypothetical protein